MTDLLDPEIRNVMRRLAERGVPSVDLVAPAVASVTVDDLDVDIEVASVAIPARRRPILAVAALLALIAVVAAGILVSGGSGPRTVEPAGTTLQWRQMASSPLSPRLGSASVWTGDRWFIWGGSAVANGSPLYLRDGATYDPAADRWNVIPDGPLSGRRLADAAALTFGHRPALGVGQPQLIQVARALDQATTDLKPPRQHGRRQPVTPRLAGFSAHADDRGHLGDEGVLTVTIAVDVDHSRGEIGRAHV